MLWWVVRYGDCLGDGVGEAFFFALWTKVRGEESLLADESRLMLDSITVFLWSRLPLSGVLGTSYLPPRLSVMTGGDLTFDFWLMIDCLLKCEAGEATDLTEFYFLIELAFDTFLLATEFYAGVRLKLVAAC